MGDYPVTVANLNTQLETLVDWETFAINLPGIEYHHIEEIKKDERTNNGQKLALYSKWLSVCPNPSWRDVAIALEGAKELTLATKIWLLMAILVMQTRMDNQKLICLKEIIVNTLNLSHLSFTRILNLARKEFQKMIEQKQITLEDCIFSINTALVHNSIPGLQTCTSVTEIFNILAQHTNFMDGSLLEAVIEHVIGESQLLKDIKEHIQSVNQFKCSIPVQEFKNRLKGFCTTRNQTQVIIRINQHWGVFHIGLVETLIKKLLNIRGELHWLRVEPGSIRITIAISTDSEMETIDNCTQQLQLIELMGVTMVQIGPRQAEATIPDHTFERATLKFNISVPENPDYTFERAILEASRVGNIEAVQLLLEMGIDANHTDEHGQTAVMVAKTIDIYQTLVRANADTSIVTHKGSTPLMVSCILGNHEVGNHLLFTLKHNITTRPDGMTLLMAASQGGNLKIVEHLLLNGHDPNIQDNNGNTAIKASCFNGHYTVTETHLEYNADPNIANHDGWTPLMAASQEGHHEIVELLLQKEVNPNVTNENGRTALMIASVNGHNEVVELLLINGAEPNAQDDDGDTAIGLSCLNNQYTVAETLLKHNADPTIANNDGYIPQIIDDNK